MEYLSFMKLCGYEDGFNPKDLDTRIDTIMDFLLDADLSDKQIHTNEDMQDVINATEKFFASHFESLHTVLTIPKNSSGIYPILSHKIDSHLEVPIIQESPFNIPIINRVDHSFQASIVRQSFLQNDFPDWYNPFVIFNIFLSKPYSMFTHTSYTHEITHSQVDTINGAIKDYHNLEVLSIFLEKLRAIEIGIDVFRQTERRRLYWLGDSLKNFYSKYTNLDYVYYVSTLKAEMLFDMYMSSSEDGKKQILGYINQIFESTLSLEDMLSFLGITLDESHDTKYMERNLKI